MEEKFYSKYTHKNSDKSKKIENKKKPLDLKKSSEQKDSSDNKKSSKNQKINKNSDSVMNYSIIDSLFNENSGANNSKLSKESDILNHFNQIIQGVRPLNSKQLQQLPDNIKNLSHQLTDDRASRRLGYMNDNIQLSSYVRYYTWWNLVRLTKLFSNLPENSFPKQNGAEKNQIICLDLGSGPLTVVTSLWLSRPELRKLNLVWYCLDVSSNALALGEDIFLSTVAKTGGEPWKIIRVKGPFGTSIKQKADFITCANMFNELDQASDMPPEFQSKKYFDQLKSYATEKSSFLLIEPGVPKASRTLALLRSRFIADGKSIVAPCPHVLECPMNGFKAFTGSQNKWCNFAFSTENAPIELQKLSEKAKLPKERATLSFISVCAENDSEKTDSCGNNKANFINCRIASDPFKLPQRKTGFYACSALGLTLVKLNEAPVVINSEDSNKKNGSKNNYMNGKNLQVVCNTLHSGDLIQVKIKTPDLLEKDEKSGAPIIEI